MMWFLLLLLYTAHVELVITQGENRLYLNGNTPCEGHIEVYHNGKRGFVGDQTWSPDIEKVVCNSTYCGVPEHSTQETVLSPISQIGEVLLNKLDCSHLPKNLWECKHPGWSASPYHSGDLRKIRCSNKIKLKLEGNHCAGVVKYSTDDGKTYSGYFCDDGWGQQEADISCKNVKCGGAKSKKPAYLTPEVINHFKGSEMKMKVKCSGITNPAHLWQCVTEESPTCKKPASVICQDYERLQLKGDTSNVCSGQLQKENEEGDWESVNESDIHSGDWCQQMHCGVKRNTSTSDSGIQLKCSDNVNVLLMDNDQPSKCYGEVYVKVNDRNHPVCTSSWTDMDAEMVCRELNCGKMISSEKHTTKSRIPGIMDNVDCSGKESSLWHCEAKHDNKPCSSTAYVVCAGSVKVRLMDGPGRCAGRVEIQHKGHWRRVNSNTWTDPSSDVVCKQMGCGIKRKHETFSQGSGEFLTKSVKCQNTANNIAECLKDESNQLRLNPKDLGITCTEHKVVILDGNGTCSGKVKIVQGTETYWLSGSDETWNNNSANTVCRQMHCGEARHIGNDVENEKSELKSYNCLSTKASLFDCEPLPSNHNGSIAFVECSEKIQITLTNNCWGTVNICVGSKCGGVCTDTWTTEKSDLLCKYLKCGDTFTAISKPPKSKVVFKSLHMETTKLEQCNFVSNDKNDSDCDPAYVVCSASVESKMDVSRDKCSGNVKVLYEGKLLPVCKDALKDSKTQKTICEELGCGQAGKLIEYFGSKLQETHAISRIECPRDSKSLTACRISASEGLCTLGGLQCSSWSKIQLTATNTTCSGAVSVVLEEEEKMKISPVSIQGWTGEAGNILCQDLQCGNLKSNTTVTLPSSWATNFSCAGEKDPKNIWSCKSVLDQENKTVDQLFIECKDKPKVTLSKQCHGEVMINGKKVCSSTWTDTESQLVCRQECGNAIIGARAPSPQRALPNTDYHHVSCESNHYKLGNCKRFMGKCEKNVVSVFCTDNHIEFNITERCGGQISVKYRGNFEKVCPLESFPQAMKEKLCQSFGCGGHNGNKEHKHKIKEDMETTLSCNNDINDMNYCVKYKTCKNQLPAEIYCRDYVIKPIIEPEVSTPVVPIILGVVFLLVLVILIVVFLRIYIVRKNKKGKNFSPRMLPRQEVEFESGDYEDVTGKENEMEDMSRGRFLPEVITENDAQSASSLPYDDIDDMLEAQHLTSQVATAGASGQNYMREDALDQNGVTYEVEDPQENYDDIEAGPEVTATEAEIHETPQTNPESDTVPPPELVEGDDDYLVPGVDG